MPSVTKIGFKKLEKVKLGSLASGVIHARMERHDEPRIWVISGEYPLKNAICIPELPKEDPTYLGLLPEDNAILFYDISKITDIEFRIGTF